MTRQCERCKQMITVPSNNKRGIVAGDYCQTYLIKCDEIKLSGECGYFVGMPFIESIPQSENNWIEKWIVITPSMAKEWLTRNVSNRKLSKNTIHDYALAMSSGQWQKSHQGIRINKDNQIVDGQHRLHAIIRAGVPIEMHVTFTDTDETALRKQIDTGLTRKVHDILGKSKMVVAEAKCVARLCSDMAWVSAHVGRVALTHDIDPIIEMIETCDATYHMTDMRRFSRSIWIMIPIRTALIGGESEIRSAGLSLLAACKANQGSELHSYYMSRMARLLGQTGIAIDEERFIGTYLALTSGGHSYRVPQEPDRRARMIAEIRQWIKRIWKIK